MRRQVAFWIFVITLGLGAWRASSAIAGPSFGGAAEAIADAPLVVPRSSVNLGIRDEAAMVLLGTILIGVAGAVRRAA
jgi:hypothetical protein